MAADHSFDPGFPLSTEERVDIDSTRWPIAHRSSPAARGALIAGLSAAAIFILVGFTRLWFNLDDWDFVAYRGLRLGNEGIFYPHNEHWSTIPILVWRAIFNVVGVRDYWLYALPLILIHLAVVYLLWRFMLRHQIETWTATLLAIAFAFVGVGGQNLIWAFQLGFVASVAFGLLAIDAIETDRTWLAPLWILCSLMCSDLGIPMAVACGCVALVQRRFRDAAIAVVPPAVVFLVWFGAVGHQGLTSSDSSLKSGDIGGLLGYMWSGLTSSLSGFIDAPHAVGILMVLLLAAAAVVYRNAPAALAASVLFFHGFVGAGRLQDGARQATSSRYSYVAIALVLPLIGWSLTQVLRKELLRPLVMIALGLVIGINVVVLHRLQQDAATAGNQAIANPQSYVAYGNQQPQLEAAAFLLHQGDTFPAEFPTNSLCAIVPNPGQCLSEDMMNVSALAALVRRNQFPVPTHVAPGVLEAERSVLDVSLVPAATFQGETGSSATAGHCTAVGPFTPLTVSSSSPELLNVYVTRRNIPPVATVTFPALDGTGSVSTLVPLSNGYSRLKLPFGHYASAVIRSLQPIQVCRS